MGRNEGRGEAVTRRVSAGQQQGSDQLGGEHHPGNFALRSNEPQQLFHRL